MKTQSPSAHGSMRRGQRSQTLGILGRDDVITDLMIEMQDVSSELIQKGEGEPEHTDTVVSRYDAFTDLRSVTA